MVVVVKWWLNTILLNIFMLTDILNVVCGQVTGLDPEDTNNRKVALDLINRAARDLYNSLEADALMRECTLLVPQDQQVSLPPFIGELRALREYQYSTTIPINEMGAPRYSSDTWKYMWRNWRLKGKQPLASSLSAASILTFTAPVIEDTNVILVVTGRTASSQKIAETVTMDALTKSTLNSFAAIDSISCILNRTYDIVVTDVNGNILATLYNNEQKTSYLLIDVSAYAWLNQVGDGTTSIVEVLYKTKFYKLFNDTDEFCCDGYDDAISYKAIELWYQGQEGKEQDAILYRAKAMEVISNNLSDKEKGQIIKISHGRNPVYNMFRRLKSGVGPRMWRN